MYICKCKKSFQSYSGLWRHKKKCQILTILQLQNKIVLLQEEVERLKNSQGVTYIYKYNTVPSANTESKILDLPPKSERVVGEMYMLNDEIRIWDGKILLCEHGKYKAQCKYCIGPEKYKELLLQQRCYYYKQRGIRISDIQIKDDD